jgi:hypothetical protein
MNQENKKPSSPIYFNEELDSPELRKTLQPVEPDSSEEDELEKPKEQ